MKSILYSLRTVNEKTIISIDLTGQVITETHLSVQVSLPTGITTISKFDYLNKMKVYDDGKVFFLLCNKQVHTDHAFEVLMKYVIDKYKKKLEAIDLLAEKRPRINEMIQKWESELVAA